MSFQNRANLLREWSNSNKRSSSSTFITPLSEIAKRYAPDSAWKRSTVSPYAQSLFPSTMSRSSEVKRTRERMLDDMLLERLDARLQQPSFITTHSIKMEAKPSL